MSLLTTCVASTQRFRAAAEGVGSARSVLVSGTPVGPVLVGTLFCTVLAIRAVTASDPVSASQYDRADRWSRYWLRLAVNPQQFSYAAKGREVSGVVQLFKNRPPTTRDREGQPPGLSGRGRSFVIVGQHFSEHNSDFAAKGVIVVLLWLAPTAVEQCDARETRAASLSPLEATAIITQEASFKLALASVKWSP
jgi:hypothetical protein